MCHKMVQYCFLVVFLFVGGLAFPTLKHNSDVNDDVSIFFDANLNNNGRIVGGTTAADGAYPWMVALTAGFMANFFLCGGAIITNRHALTAAHCVDALFASGSAGNARIIAETNTWDKGGTRYSVRLVARNPEYDAATRKNDIGIVGTALEISFNDRASPITINYDFISGGILVRVSGWGWRQAGGTLSDELQELRLLTLDGPSCGAEVRRVAQSLGVHVPVVDYNVEICTFLTGNEGICVGDSGSPLVRNSNNQLVGVASWGVACARGAPDVFTRVSVYRAWIQLVLDLPF